MMAMSNVVLLKLLKKAKSKLRVHGIAMQAFAYSLQCKPKTIKAK